MSEPTVGLTASGLECNVVGYLSGFLSQSKYYYFHITCYQFSSSVICYDIKNFLAFLPTREGENLALM